MSFHEKQLAENALLRVKKEELSTQKRRQEQGAQTQGVQIDQIEARISVATEESYERGR